MILILVAWHSFQKQSEQKHSAWEDRTAISWIGGFLPVYSFFLTKNSKRAALTGRFSYMDPSSTEYTAFFCWFYKTCFAQVTVYVYVYIFPVKVTKTVQKSVDAVYSHPHKISWAQTFAQDCLFHRSSDQQNAFAPASPLALMQHLTPTPTPPTPPPPAGN